MASIRTLNLHYERRIRGTYPVSRYALDDAGTLTLAMPRPLEARSYDLMRVSAQGDTEARRVFSVETLQELKVSALSENFLGMTVDDVYLFHDGGKGRFLEGKRLCYVDTALSADGQTFIAGFSDMAGASYVVAFGGIDGRVIWTRQIETPLTKLDIARTGERLVLATDTGVISLIDAGMRTLYDFVQEETVSALACSRDALTVVYGTVGGGVGAIDGNGTRLWEARLPGTVTTLALSGDGSLCAALVQVGDAIHLYCLIGQGQVGWEHTLEKRFVGLSLSDNGQWLAIGAKDGTAALYEIVQSEWAEADGDNTERLRNFLAQHPTLPTNETGIALYREMREILCQPVSDMQLLTKAIIVRGDWYLAFYKEFTRPDENKDYARNLTLIKAALENNPCETAFTEAYHILSKGYLEAQCADARTLIEANEIDRAAVLLRELLAAYPFDPDMHTLLFELNEGQASTADADADALLSKGDLENGVAALERAQNAHPTPERAAKIGRARTALEFAAGLADYNARRYQEAIFQFKKVLVRDPEHSEARRYLGFAQSFLSDASNNALTDRFNMLE